MTSTIVPGAADRPGVLPSERLLANGDRWEREIAQSLALDAPYR